MFHFHVIPYRPLKVLHGCKINDIEHLVTDSLAPAGLFLSDALKSSSSGPKTPYSISKSRSLFPKYNS